MKNQLQSIRKLLLTKLSFVASTLLVLMANLSFAQTVLINPSGDGGFENGTTFAANGWTVSNSINNPWVLGTNNGYSVLPIANRSVFIRDTGTAVAYYDVAKNCNNFFYRDVTVPAGETKILLSFNWMLNGENNWDNWQVFVADTNTLPVGSTTHPGSGANNVPAAIPNAVFIGNGTVAGTGVQTAFLQIPATYAGTRFRLIFSWKSDNSGGVQPPAIIDNISLTSQAPLISAAGGNFTVNSALPTGGNNFNSFLDAVADINVYTWLTLNNNVNINVLSGQTFTGNFPEITATGNPNARITFIKSGSGANPVIATPGSASSTDYGIGIAGSDYLTLDGIDVVATTNAVEFGYRIRNSSATNGAKYIIVRNANIRLDSTNSSSIGIAYTASTTGGGFSPTAASGQNDSSTFNNLTITNCGLGGIQLLSGSITFLGNVNKVFNVSIGTNYTGAPTGNMGGFTTAGAYGITATNQSDIEIYNCTIRNIVSSGIKRGILLTGGRGIVNIYNNRIWGIRNNLTTSTNSSRGIDANLSTTGTNTLNIYNNNISDLTADYTGAATASRLIVGIFNGTGSATSNINISNNTVVIDGSGCLNASNVCMEWGGSTAIYNVRNNNFVNLTGAQTGVAKHYVVRTASANAAGAANSVINFNNYFNANTTNGFIALLNTTDAATIAAFNAGITTPAQNDTITVSVDPNFLNVPARNFIPQNTALDNSGVPISGVDFDINGTPRSITNPDRSSHEFTLALATVQTSRADSVSQNGARLFGNIVNSLPLANSSGIVYSTTPNPTVGGLGSINIATSPNVTTGGFNVYVSALLPSTTYYYRAYAINSIGTAYGEERTFTTSFPFPYVENFDGAYNANANGWRHTRFFYTGDGVPAPLNTLGPKDWMQNKNTGLATWTSQGFGTNPNIAISDSGALWIEDASFANSTVGNANFNYSRVESPGIDLSASINPYVRFYYFANQTPTFTYPLILMASTDNGQTWKSIMRIQPNAAVASTSTTGIGTMSSATPWQRITVKVPDAYKTVNTKFAFYRNAAFSSSNLFIDSLFVGEFTPTTITSAQTGLWSSPSTWVGGVIPNADNDVVIASGHTVTSDVNIARMQNLTINGTYIFFSTSTSMTAQIFGNLNISSTGVFNAGTSTNTAVGRFVYIGEGINNNGGTLNMGTATTNGIYLIGGIPSTIFNGGTITSGYISQIFFANSGGISFSPLTVNNVVVRNTAALIDGPVTPNDKLTLGLTGNAITIVRGVPEAFFTSRPLYPNLSTFARSVTYGGGVNGNFQQAILSRDTIFTGNETDSLPGGINFIRGTLSISTNHHVKLNRPLQVGDTIGRTTLASVNTGVGGATTFSRGLLFTDATNILTVGPNSTGSIGIVPSLNTLNPPSTHGSYIIGPVRFVRPSAGTLTSSFNVPFGLGSNYMGASVIDNTRRYITVSAGGGWLGQIIECEMLPTRSSAVSPPQTSLIGRNIFRIQPLENAVLPAASTVLLSTYEEAGKSNRDLLFGSQDQLFVVQSANINGPYTVRSTTTGTGAFAQNTLYTRTTATTAPGPVSGNGNFFSFGTSAPIMQFLSADVDRNITSLAAGSSNMQMLRLRVNVNGVIPSFISALNLNTTGTTNTSSITNAKVYFTGNDSTFNTNTQVGSTVNAPNGNFNVSLNQQLLNGSNFFWVTYDVASSATIGQILVANLTGITVADTLRTPITTPASGGRTVSAPMTFVAANAFQTALSRVGQNSVNNEILRLEVQMSATGSSTPVTNFICSTNGSAQPAVNIANAKIYYTGTSPVFNTSQLVGTFNAPNGTFNIASNINLNNNINYFWLTYDIAATAVINDSVDAEFTSVTINNIVNPVSIQAPAGSRQIRGQYCTTAYASGCGTDFIARVRLENLDNSTGCNGQYTYFNSLPVPNLTAGTSYTITLNYGSDANQFGRAWIDYNDDGDFNDVGEDLGAQIPANAGSNGQAIISFTVPCTAVNGRLRLRIRGGDDSQPLATQSCAASSSGWGEGEDYDVNVISASAAFLSTTAIQQTGSVGAGSTNVPVLRVPIRVTSTPCSPGLITQLNFNTAGTTNTANILAAKLYRTGANNTFSTLSLVGTISSPSGAFSFSFADSTNNDTNNYWLAYDIASNAANSNLLDARFDSAQALGAWRLPVNGNPAGSLIVTVPMTYISSDVAHPTFAQIERGTNNNVILRARVVTSSTGASIAATQFNLTTNGSANITANVDSIIVWYTGTNSNFVSPQFFGSTGAQTAPFSINGNTNLTNDTNYFWVTYNVRSTANIGDSVDAEILGITIAGIPQIPSVTAPTGARYIRAPYCIPNISSGCGIDYISQVTTLGAVTNISNITTCNGNTNAFIHYNQLTVTAAKGAAFTINLMAGGDVEGLGVWIDFNNNGIYEASEFVFSAPPSINVLQTGTITVPCNALNGMTRMRVRAMYNYTPQATDACTNNTWGETEDYNFNIIDIQPSFQFANTLQQTGSTSAGANNVPILRLPVSVISTSCNRAIATTFRFNTTGTTNVANIVSAKLYKTTGNTFNTNNLLGTIASPSGQFTFNVNDTMNNDTNNYWLAYDVSGTATNSNVLDARFDSAEIIGAWRKPLISAPAGNVLISTPMTFLSATSVHTTLSKIDRGTTNNVMLRMRVIMSATGAPVQLTQFALSTNGSINTAINIDSIIVWGTGANPNFVSPVFYGATGTQNGAYNINGLTNLLNDTNYFWVTYRVPGTANVGDSLDAEVNGININSVVQVPAVTAPAGSRQIKAPYCASGATVSADSDIGQLTISSGATTIVNNGIGCSPVTNNTLANGTYTNFTGLAPGNLPTGTIANVSVCYVSSGAEYASQAAIYIDYNDNGTWDAGEMVWNSTTATVPFGNSFLTGTFIVPANTPLGLKRMRVVLTETTTPLSLANSCNTFFYGETEDYVINIVAGNGNTYAWNQTNPGLFNTAANWTPNRTIHNIADRLLFANGGNRIVNDVLENPVATVVVNNNTNVTLNANSTVRLSASDTLALNAGIINANNNLILLVGSSAGSSGTIVGSGGVNGLLGRWINTATASYNFPIVTANRTNRNMTLDYTTAPTARGLVVASFMPGLPGNNGLPLTDNFINVNRAGENGVFSLLAGNGLTGGTYTLTFQADSFKGVNAVFGLTVIRRNNNASPWTTAGTFVNTTGTNISPLLSRSGLTVYGEFGVGGDTLINPLPVSMLSFTANELKGNVLLHWSTANELNNKGFEIERSVNGKDFELIDFVNGMGNTRNISNYKFIDYNAFNLTGVQTLYYRLRQMDFNGTYAYTNIVSVNLNDALNEGVVVYPNPFSTDLGIEINSVDNGDAAILVTDINGKLISSENIQVNAGKQFHSLKSLDMLSNGIYFVTLNQGNKTYHVKVTKVN